MAKKVEKVVTVEDKGNKMLNILKNRVVNTAEAQRDAREKHLPDKKLKPFKDATKAAVDDYNKLVEKLYYRKLYAEYKTNALYEALKHDNCLVPGAIAVRFKADGDTGAVSYEIGDDKTKRIDLTVFRAETAPECFHSDDWFDKLDTLSKIVTNDASKRLNTDPVYQITLDEAAQIFGFEVDPKNEATLIHAFQSAVDSLIWRGDDESKNAIDFGEAGMEYVYDGFKSVDNKSTNKVGVGSPSRIPELVCCRINVVLLELSYNLVVAK